MTKQKLIDWLIPRQTEPEQLDTEIITNKKFIFMVTLGLGLIILCEVFLK